MLFAAEYDPLIDGRSFYHKRWLLHKVPAELSVIRGLGS